VVDRRRDQQQDQRGETQCRGRIQSGADPSRQNGAHSHELQKHQVVHQGGANDDDNEFRHGTFPHDWEMRSLSRSPSSGVFRMVTKYLPDNVTDVAGGGCECCERRVESGMLLSLEFRAQVRECPKKLTAGSTTGPPRWPCGSFGGRHSLWCWQVWVRG